MTYAIAYPKTEQLVVAPSLDQTQIIYDTLVDIATCPNLHGDIVCKASPFPEVRVGDSFIRMRTAGEATRGKRIRGRAANRVIIDEGAFVHDEVITQVILPMLGDEPGCQLVIVSTPFGRNHFYRRYLEGLADNPSRDPQARSWNFTTFDNPHVDHQYFRGLQERMTDIQYRSEVLAEFVAEVAGVFAWEDIQRCLDHSLEDVQPTSDAKYVIGVDLGKYRDYSCIVVLDDTKLPVRLVHLQRFGRVPWPEQKARIRTVSRLYGRPPIVLDSTGVGDPVADDLEREDQLIYRYQFTYETKRRLVENLAQFVALRRVRFPYIKHLVEEMQYYSYVLAPSGTHIRFRGMEGYYDDTVVALALACWPSRTLLRSASLKKAEKAARKKRKPKERKPSALKPRPHWEAPGLPEDLRKAAR